MTSTVQNIRIIEGAVARWSRSNVPLVTRAYETITRLEATELGHDLDPMQHMHWIRSVGEVHILPRSRLDECVEWALTGAATDLDIKNGDAISFDPTRHIVVATQPGILSYLVDASLPDRVPVLGKGAMGLSPHFKCCVVWWA